MAEHYLCIRYTNQAALRYWREHGIKVLPYEPGKVYTLRGVNHGHNGRIWLKFHEVVQPLRANGEEIGVNPKYFRKLDKLTVEQFLKEGVLNYAD